LREEGDATALHGAGEWFGENLGEESVGGDGVAEIGDGVGDIRVGSGVKGREFRGGFVLVNGVPEARSSLNAVQGEGVRGWEDGGWGRLKELLHVVPAGPGG
jgi:hypothetical protein